ncbi:hypothetical protein FBU30_002696 [Linnemannia zychae]|nr:hypothetical protein FBU30_002696 [Linnemannia zychae]
MTSNEPVSQRGFSSPISSFALLNQIYYVLITTLVFMAATLPFLRATVLSYGKLDSTPTPTPRPSTLSASPSTVKKSVQFAPVRRSWIAAIRSLQVPKVWFGHFYPFATLWMIYMTFDLWVYSSSAVVLPPTRISFSTKTTIIRSIPAVLSSTRQYWSLLTFLNYLGIMPAHIPPTLTQSITEPKTIHAWIPPPHVLLTMACYFIQVIRRWYETWFVERPSAGARMHIAHYIVGITFYSAMAPTTWIDAYEAWVRQSSSYNPAGILSAEPLDSILFGLNGQCLLGLVIFIWASWHQFNCHTILANLRPQTQQGAKESQSKKPEYKVPLGDWFQYMVTPHYSAEMLIYLGLYLMASSSPLTANSSTAPTLLFAWLWVVTNLGVVARETDQWYRSRFGDNYAAMGASAKTKPGSLGRASRRYILIPYIY